MKDLIVKEVGVKDFSRVQDFYTSVGHSRNIIESDRVVMATLNDKVVGGARISLEEGVLVLRGMQVDRSMLGRGIGRLMLYELDKIINGRVCYCLPHDWLIHFYEIIGFKQIASEFAPSHLQNRLHEYLEKYPQLIIMAKNWCK